MKQPNDFAELISTLTLATKSVDENAKLGVANNSDASAIASIGSLVKTLTDSTIGTINTSGAKGISNGATVDQLLTQLVKVASTGKEQSETLRKNTNAIEVSSGKSSADGLGLDVFKGVASVLSGGLLPVVSSLLKAFSDTSNTTQQTPIVKFPVPASINADAGLSGSGDITLVDRNEKGNVRPINTGPQITVQVQAMDSRSFMDRSDDIARAVRDAMLHSSSLNDVVQDL